MADTWDTWAVIIDGLFSQEVADDLANEFRNSIGRPLNIDIRVARTSDLRGRGYQERPGTYTDTQGREQEHADV